MARKLQFFTLHRNPKVSLIMACEIPKQKVLTSVSIEYVEKLLNLGAKANGTEISENLPEGLICNLRGNTMGKSRKKQI